MLSHYFLDLSRLFPPAGASGGITGTPAAPTANIFCSRRQDVRINGTNAALLDAAAAQTLLLPDWTPPWTAPERESRPRAPITPTNSPAGPPEQEEAAQETPHPRVETSSPAAPPVPIPDLQSHQATLCLQRTAPAFPGLAPPGSRRLSPPPPLRSQGSCSLRGSGRWLGISSATG